MVISAPKDTDPPRYSRISRFRTEGKATIDGYSLTKRLAPWIQTTSFLRNTFDVTSCKPLVGRLHTNNAVILATLMLIRFDTYITICFTNGS